MRQLTFAGFLDAYVRALAGCDTRSLPQLVELSRTQPRLVHPLLLWAVTTGRAERLSRLLTDSQPKSDLTTLSHLQAAGTLVAALEDEAPQLAPEYAKVWRSYVAKRDAHLRDSQLKLAARQRVLDLESQKHVTRYRMAKDLGLNPGNLHAFLAQGNASKLSLDRAFALVEYLEAA